MSGVPDITWSFGEGRYLDLWTFVHFLTGVPFALAAIELGLGRGAYFAALALFVLWEVFEAATKTPEEAENRVIDVFVTLAGFAVAYEVFAGNPSGWGWVTAAFAVSGALNLGGWIGKRRPAA